MYSRSITPHPIAYIFTPFREVGVLVVNHSFCCFTFKATVEPNNPPCTFGALNATSLHEQSGCTNWRSTPDPLRTLAYEGT